MRIRITDSARRRAKSRGEIFPLYNILKVGHPSYLSTVTEETLQAFHLRIPRTPSPYPGVGYSPWHNLGTDLVSPATARDAIEAAGLNYTVVKKPLKEVVRPDHRADVSGRWATVRTDTGDILGVVGDSYRMALTKISDKQLLDFVKALVPDNEEGDNAKIQGVRRAFHELYESGQGADLSRGTLWGAFNCVTEYADHKMDGNPASRLASIWFGRGEQLKMKAFQLAGRMMYSLTRSLSTGL